MLRDLAAVCCHFNPCHYRARLENYRRFRANVERGGVELLTVELAFGDDDFELADVPNTLQLRGGDVLWQKERLLNIGLAELVRRGYAKLVWLDADVLFLQPDRWAQHVAAALDQHALVQVFDKAVYCSAAGRPGPRQLGCAAYQRLTGQWDNWVGARGFGWGLRSALFQTVPLYDAAILGGGDTLMHFACHAPAGRDVSNGASAWRRYLRLFPTAFAAHWLAWAERWNQAIQGDVGYAGQALHVLYHGDWRRRAYMSRFEILKRHAFDPRADIACLPGGGWRWATTKPELHRQVAEYFISRREDGVMAESCVLLGKRQCADAAQILLSANETDAG